MKATTRKTPTFGYALLVMVVVFSTIMIPSLAWGASINALFLMAWVVAIILCLPLGVPYKELQEGMVNNCKRAIVPVMIILCVGALVGTWNAAGTVPLIISFGVQAISPHMFLATAFLLCTLTALVTGTSWGTFGTAGLALAGIGVGLNVDPVMTAGAVCAGAFFGDTISPMSDSPNIAAAVSGVDLFKGIKHQAKVTVPAAVICLVLYYFVGLQYRSGEVDTSLIADITTAIGNHFHSGILTMLPAIFVIALLAFKIPSIPAILSGAIFGGVVACTYQGHTVKEAITYFWSGFTIDTGVEFVDKLLNRGGVTSMTSTGVMFLFAFGLFGILDAAGIVNAFIEPFTKHMKSKLSLVVATLIVSVFGTLVGASMNFAYAFSGSIMEPIYEKRGLEKVNLMRALGVGCTAMAVLVPWSLSTTVAIPFLGVEPMQLVPYNFFLFVAPVVLIIWTIIGKDTKWVSEAGEAGKNKTAEKAVKS